MSGYQRTSSHQILFERSLPQSMLLTDWPSAILRFDFQAGEMKFDVPALAVESGLPDHLHVSDISKIEWAAMGNRAIRWIAFAILLAVPYTINLWIEKVEWQYAITVSFVAADFILASMIHRWLSLPLIRISFTRSNLTSSVSIMGNGLGSVLATRLVAQDLADLLMAHKSRIMIPDFGTVSYWQGMNRRLILAFAMAVALLVVAGCSLLVSDILRPVG